VFSLDTAQAAAATTAGVFSSLNNRIGLSASASNATGGPDTFFVTSSSVTGGGGGGGGAGGAVPEPATYVLIGAGLVAFGIKSRNGKFLVPFGILIVSYQESPALRQRLAGISFFRLLNETFSDSLSCYLLTNAPVFRKMERFGELILLLLRYPSQCLRAARLLKVVVNT